MKVRYSAHPPAYALGETEKFYGEMEARGWRLKKRGGTFSKFVPVEPSAARYRVEVLAPSLLESPEMSEEQLAVYEDCGWTYVTDSGCLYIFRAPAGSDAPEFYMDPRQQAETLKALRRRDRWALALALLLVGVNFLVAFSLGRGGRESMAELRRTVVDATAMFLLYVTALAGALAAALGESWHYGRLYRRMKRGIPMDHHPGGRGLWYKIPRWCFRGLVALFALLAAVQLLGMERYDLPQTAGGPYVLLADMGYGGQRTHNWANGETSRVEYCRSLLARRWHVQEFLEENGEDVWLYQDVYRLSGLVDREGFARTLMEDSVFARGAESYVPVELPGLDRAWMVQSGQTGMEVVAIRGPYVLYAEHLSPALRDQETALASILAAFAAVSLPED